MSGPSFILIGEQKTGTTTLRNWLSLVGVPMANAQEIHFFNRQKIPDMNGMGRLAWYHQWFPKSDIVGEVTPDYLYHPESLPAIHSYNPKMKIIVGLREPISRALSAYWMIINRDKVKHDWAFFDCRNKEVKENTYYTIPDKRGVLARGFYASNLSRLFEYFPQSQIHFYQFDDLKEKPLKVLLGILDFIGMPSMLGAINPDITNQAFRVGNYHEEAPQWLIDSLSEFYHPHNQKLKELLIEYGRTPPKWVYAIQNQNQPSNIRTFDSKRVDTLQPS